MEYQIALAPELGLTPADFVQSWNASSDAHAIAEARLTPTTSSSYEFLIDGTIAVLGSIAIGVAGNLIADLIKDIITKKTPHKHLHITQVDKPDGTHILVIDSKVS